MRSSDAALVEPKINTGLVDALRDVGALLTRKGIKILPACSSTFITKPQDHTSLDQRCVANYLERGRKAIAEIGLGNYFPITDICKYDHLQGSIWHINDLASALPQLAHFTPPKWSAFASTVPAFGFVESAINKDTYAAHMLASFVKLEIAEDSQNTSLGIINAFRRNY